jgi:uncharacterized C2H2 Zn-finger protein
MIDRMDGDLVFHCDSCTELFESETDDFNEAWSNAKREGWTVRKMKVGMEGEWFHKCPECSKTPLPHRPRD